MKIIILLSTFFYFSRSLKYDDCGSTITTSNGGIVNPSYPYASPANTNCTFTFVPTIPRQWLFLNFDTFQLSEDDYLMIKEKNATLKFQGIKSPFIVVVDAESNVTLITSAKSKNSIFRASYDNQKCVSTTFSSHGLIMSPTYSQRLTPDSFTCSWVVSPSADSRSLLLSFAEFKLNDNTLSVYKDQTEIIAKYSGNEIPSDVIVGSMLVKIELSVQVSLPMINFKLEFADVALDCAKTSHIKDLMVLNEFPQFPEPVECVWILNSDPKTTLMIKFGEMNLYNLQDSVLINDGNSRYSTNLKTIDYATKNITGMFLTSSSNFLYISFLMVPVVGLSNFKLNISVQTQGGTYFNEGNFNFDKTSTFNGQDVVYSLIVNSSLMVQVSIEADDLTQSSEILLYEVDENEQKLLTVFNKDSELFPVFSKSNKMSVVLRGFVGTEKFNGEFHGIIQGCDVFDQTNVGSYELIKAANDNCTWLIKPADFITGDMISLSFSQLHLKNKDIVAIYKGLSNNYKNLVQVFNSQFHGQPQLYIESKHGIRIDMQIESQGESQVIAFYQLKGGCNTNLTLSTTDKMQISSVGYPSHYLLNMNCKWRVFAPSNKTLFINFADVDMYSDNSLQLYVIRNGSEELIEATNGLVFPDDIIVDTQELVVTWNSTSSYQPWPVRGFLLNVRILDCGGNLTSSSGQLSTPGYPYPENKTVDCIWGIAVPRPASQSVNIINFDIKQVPSAEARSTFEIFDGGSLTSSIFKDNVTTLSRTNKLLVRYINKGGVASGYQVSFSSRECTKSHQCKNGICMHDEWRCNDINDCGDFSDEENCDSFGRKPGVSMPWFGASIAMTFVFGIAITLLIPVGIKRYRRWKQDQEPGHFSILADESSEFQ